MMRTTASLLLSTTLLFTARTAFAATCDISACTSAIAAAPGLVVNDVFHDANGLPGTSLPVFGNVIDNWPGCPEHIDFAGAGHSLAPFDCPGQYAGDAVTPTVDSARMFLGSLDRRWWQPCRLADPTVTAAGCLANTACIGDGVGGNYLPWTGLVFDLRGPANQVVIFGQNDHGPQPCESLEYTVFFTNNPFAHGAGDVVLDPATNGIDPMRWNRASLSRIFTGGWVQVRPADPVGHAACGDTADYSVEEDSFAQVFTLPCGVTLRYAAIVAGNDGLDYAGCAYESNEGEIDAVAGLTASGAGVCPDTDSDGFSDCGCPSAPSVCDCNDADPNVHPGAVEACDASDLNCDGVAGGCASGFTCHASACLVACSGAGSACARGTTCQSTSAGMLCVPVDCGCAPGEVCVGGTCTNACSGIVCPVGQACRDGECVDPCAGVVCPTGERCENGSCHFPCACLVGDTACADGAVCDRSGSATCVASTCVGVACTAGTMCRDSTGMCESLCGASVVCPSGEHCVDPMGCVPLCTGVSCTSPESCNPATGACDDPACRSITCTAPATCVAGVCVVVDAGSDGGADAGAVVDSGTDVVTDTGSMDVAIADATDSGPDAPSTDTGPRDASMDTVANDASPNEPATNRGGCGCRTQSTRAGDRAAWSLFVSAMFATLASRRRARRKASR